MRYQCLYLILFLSITTHASVRTRLCANLLTEHPSFTNIKTKILKQEDVQSLITGMFPSDGPIILTGATARQRRVFLNGLVNFYDRANVPTFTVVKNGIYSTGGPDGAQWTPFESEGLPEVERIKHLSTLVDCLVKRRSLVIFDFKRRMYIRKGPVVGIIGHAMLGSYRSQPVRIYETKSIEVWSLPKKAADSGAYRRFLDGAAYKVRLGKKD